MSAPIPMLLACPVCHARHIDEGVYATKPHRTHVCQSCGMVWRPALVHTVGVDFLPGYGPPSPNDDDSHVRGLWTQKATGQVFEVTGWALRGVVPGDNVYMRPVGADQPLCAVSLETLRQEYLRTTEPAK